MRWGRESQMWKCGWRGVRVVSVYSEIVMSQMPPLLNLLGRKIRCGGIVDVEYRNHTLSYAVNCSAFKSLVSRRWSA